MSVEIVVAGLFDFLGGISRVLVAIRGRRRGRGRRRFLAVLGKNVVSYRSELIVNRGIDALEHLIILVLTPLDVAEVNLRVGFVENKLARDKVVDEIIHRVLERLARRYEVLSVAVEHADELVLVDFLLFRHERVIPVLFAGVVGDGHGADGGNDLLVVALVVVLEKRAAGEQPQAHNDYQK